MTERQINVHNQVPDLARARELAAAARGHRTLHELLRWTNHQDPPLHDVEVVTQDEFTHDVIVADGTGLYLIYDAT